MTIHTFIDYVPTRDGKRLEPALMLGRNRRAVAIPLSMAYEFADDATAIQKAVQYAEKLYGSDGYARSEVFEIVDKITWALVDLVKAPPPEKPSVDPVLRAMERQRLHFRADGKTVIDAR